MEKSESAFRTISEASTSLDIAAHVLRYWESKFLQIKPVKRAGGRRYYRPQDILLLAGIKSLLYSEGLTIKGVQKILHEQGIQHVIALGAASNMTKVKGTSVFDNETQDTPVTNSNIIVSLLPKNVNLTFPELERAKILTLLMTPNTATIRRNADTISLRLTQLEALRDHIRQTL